MRVEGLDVEERAVAREARAGRTLRAAARALAPELRPMLRLAGPVVLAEVGWMAMGIVDTLMVGALGAEAIGAVGLGNVVYITVSICGYGLLLGLDPLIAQAFGAGRVDECHRWLLHGVYLAVILSPPVMALTLAMTPWLGAWGTHPDVLRAMGPFVAAVSVSTLPLFLGAAFRRYLQAMNLVRPITFALISANVINAAANWVLIYGHLGFPALGVAGSGWSTSLSRLYMALVMIGAAVWHDRRSRGGLGRISPWPEWGRMRRLVALGLPAATQLTLEVGVFGLATALVARIHPVALAAHEIVLQCSSLTFMVPLGVASAGAVRVGQAIGRGDAAGAARSGWMALALGAGFMACSGLTFLLAPRTIVGAFTPDPEVLATGTALLGLAALFQLFDGLQVVATGVLRGTGDTRTPMVTNVLAHWAIGLPVGYALAFPYGRGVFGLWVGLSLGLIVAGLALLGVWARTARRLAGMVRGADPTP